MAQAGFNSLRSDAYAAQGSVFDTLFNKALRFGASDQMGGLSPQAAITGPAGPTAASWLRNMARRIAGNKPSQADDLIQAAMEAVQREGGTLNPRNAMRQSKSTMLKAREAGGQGTRSSVARAISKAEGRVGTAGELRLWSETNKHLSKPISLDRFRKARSGIRQETVSLDQPLTAEGRTTMGDMLKGVDNPESAAILEQGLSRLTPAQQQNLLKRFQGENVNPAILQRIQQKLRGGKDPNPISGGSGDQFTRPDHPAFSTHSLYKIQQELEPGSGIAMSPKDLVTKSREMGLGPQGEAFYGQPSYPQGARPGIDWAAPEPIPLRTSPQLGGPGGRVLQDPYGTIPGTGENMGMTSKDTIKPGPYPQQSIGGFQQLQRMIMDALLNSGRN